MEKIFSYPAVLTVFFACGLVFADACFSSAMPSLVYGSEQEKLSNPISTMKLVMETASCREIRIDLRSVRKSKDRDGRVSYSVRMIVLACEEIQAIEDVIINKSWGSEHKQGERSLP